MCVNYVLHYNNILYYIIEIGRFEKCYRFVIAVIFFLRKNFYFSSLYDGYVILTHSKIQSTPTKPIL